jgi:hypothetical protein
MCAIFLTCQSCDNGDRFLTRTDIRRLSDGSTLAILGHCHTTNRGFIVTFGEGVSGIKFVACKALVKAVRLVQQASCKHQGDLRLGIRCFVFPFPVPSQSPFADESQARIRGVVGEHAEPLLLMTMEPFQTRSTTQTLNGSENLAADAHIVLFVDYVHVHARGVAETSGADMQTQILPSSMRLWSQRPAKDSMTESNACSILAASAMTRGTYFAFIPFGKDLPKPAFARARCSRWSSPASYE